MNEGSVGVDHSDIFPARLLMKLLGQRDCRRKVWCRMPLTGHWQREISILSNANEIHRRASRENTSTMLLLGKRRAIWTTFFVLDKVSDLHRRSPNCFRCNLSDVFYILS